MIELSSLQEINDVIKKEPFCLLYLSRPACGVCLAVKPKIEDICNKYSNVKQYYVNLDLDESISGQLSIFTIPAILIYVDGKEALREARYFSIDDIDEKLGRLIQLSK